MSIVVARPTAPPVIVGNQLSDMLLSAPKEALASSLALLEELSLYSLMASKTLELFEKAGNRISRGTWTADSDRFQNTLAAKTAANRCYSPGELLLQIWGELKKLTSVTPRDFRSGMDFSEMAEDLSRAAVNQLRSNKDSGFSGNDLPAMIEFQMSKMFGGLEVSLSQLTVGEQDKLVAKIQEFLQSLSSEQQGFIMDKLGTTQLTDAAIRTAVTNGTMWAAFAGAVQVFGFAFYTTAAQLLAIVSLHLLPFGAYVGLSSFIAVLASPLFLPVLAGVGLFYYGRQNSQIRSSLVPVVITSLCLAGMEQQAKDPSYRSILLEDALGLWGDARAKRDTCRSEQAQAQAKLNALNDELRTLKNKLLAHRTRLSQAESQRTSLNTKLEEVVYASISPIARGDWGPSLVGAAREVQLEEAKIEGAWGKVQSAEGFWATTIELLSYATGAIPKHVAVYEKKQALFSAVKWAQLPDNVATEKSRELLTGISEADIEIGSARSDVRQFEGLAENKQSEVSSAERVLKDAKLRREDSEKRYAGLGVV